MGATEMCPLIRNSRLLASQSFESRVVARFAISAATRSQGSLCYFRRTAGRAQPDPSPRLLRSLGMYE